MSKIHEELPPDSLEQSLLVRKQKLEELISIKKQEIAHAPQGNLRISRNKGTTQYYLVTENQKLEARAGADELHTATNKHQTSIDKSQKGKEESKQKKYPINNGIYISKTKMEFIKSLAQNDYNIKVLAQLEGQLQGVNLALEKLKHT